MVKLIVVYKKPADVAAFEKHYVEVHTPLAKKMPGLRKLEVARCFGSPGGAEPRYYMVAEMSFDTKDALFAGLSSPEGKAAGKDIMGLAGEYLHMMFANAE